MLKDHILQILDRNKELIKDAFSIDDNGIDGIIDSLNKDYGNFKQIVDDVFSSDIGIREKMVMCYLLGFVNGERNERRMSRIAKTIQDIAQMSISICIDNASKLKGYYLSYIVLHSEQL